MDDPQRLLDGSGTALERSLLQELRSYRGTDEMRKHTLAALAAAGSAGLATGSALALGKTWTWGNKLVLTVSVASALVGVPASYFIMRHSAAVSAPPAPATKPLVQRSPVVPASPAGSAQVVDGPVSPAPASVARISRRGATPNPDLRAELEALDKVRSNMVRGDFIGSLSLLDAYLQKFHHGRLHLEAEVLRIDALAKSGQAEAARAHAKEFLRRNPKSVHAARLQSIVAD
ncbi:MAG TPA: hypothetical protein VIV60_03930 [Polyangiaceae bacterium]